jgi:hypothetical protein
MSDDNFIGRWSRLKRETESEKRRPERSRQSPPEARTEATAVPSAQLSAAPGEAHRVAAPPFDPATLPPIDSIVAGTDIRAFLQKGVPVELTKAALRRVWTTDPAIRDFIEVAENQWDFTDPASIPGFGPLQAGDEVRQLTSQAMGKLPEASQPVNPSGETEGLSGEKEGSRPLDSQPAPAATDAAPAPPQRESAADHETLAVAASQHPEPASDGGPAPKRKGHGAAMPR